MRERKKTDYRPDDITPHKIDSIYEDQNESVEALEEDIKNFYENIFNMRIFSSNQPQKPAKGMCWFIQS